MAEDYDENTERGIYGDGSENPAAVDTPNTNSTPLPWLVRNLQGSDWIVDATPDVGGRFVGQIIAGPCTNPKWEGNARLIVTAVNSHAALVAAATDALNALDDRYDGTSDGRTLWMGRHIDALRKALKAGRAAKGATTL